MIRVSAIVLAAGESRRMGGTNKLTLPIDGVPLLRRTAQTLLKVNLQERVVVLGHQADVARGLLEGLAFSTVTNENYREGQMSSVHAGLNALKEACDAVLICLSDQPLLEAEDITVLLDAFAQRTRGAVLVPMYRGQRGNPVMLDAARRAAILSGARNLGCRHLIENNPELVCTVEMENDHVIVDLDTPEAYAAVLARLGEPPARLAM